MDSFECVCGIVDLAGVRSLCHLSAPSLAVVLCTSAPPGGPNRERIRYRYLYPARSAAWLIVLLPQRRYQYLAPARSALFLHLSHLRPLASFHPPPASQSFVFLIYPLPPILSFPIHSFFPVPSPPCGKPCRLPIFDLEPRRRRPLGPLNDGSSLGHEPADPKQARTARVVPAATTRPCPPDFVHKRSFEVTSRDPRGHRPFHDAPFFDIRGPALFDARLIFPRVQFSLASIRSALGFKRPSDGLRAHRSTSTNDLN